MKIKKRLVESITKKLTAYKAAVDETAAGYACEFKALEEDLKAKKGVYTDEYIEESRRNFKPTKNYKKTYTELQATTKASLETDFKRIEQAIESYFNAPVRADFANKINAIAITGLPLTDYEFDLLGKNVNSYMEARLLSHMAASREKKVKETTFNTQGEIETNTKSVSNGYNMPDMIGIDEAKKAFETYKAGVLNFIDGYCGENIELYEFRSCNRANFGSESVDKAVASTHKNYLINGYDTEFCEVFDRMNAIINENGTPEPLNADEKGLIDKLIDPNFKYAGPSEAKRLASENEILRGLLERDERYSQYVPDPADFELPLS